MDVGKFAQPHNSLVCDCFSLVWLIDCSIVLIHVSAYTRTKSGIRARLLGLDYAAFRPTDRIKVLIRISTRGSSLQKRAGDRSLLGHIDQGFEDLEEEQRSLLQQRTEKEPERLGVATPDRDFQTWARD